jgi:hypothetical protein
MEYYYRAKKYTSLYQDTDIVVLSDTDSLLTISIDINDPWLFLANDRINDVTDLYHKKMKKISKYKDINREDINEKSLEMWVTMSTCSEERLQANKNEFKQFINGIYRLIKSTNMSIVGGINIFNIQ